MTAEEPKPSSEEPESSSDDTESSCEEPDDSSEGEDIEYTPLTREDFGPGEEWARDMFFAFRDEMDERQAEYEAREALKHAAEADK